MVEKVRVATRLSTCRGAMAMVAVGAVLSGLAVVVAPPAVAASGTTEWISVTSTGGKGDANSGEMDMSADGRFVVFASEATNMVPGDTNGARDVFLRDRQGGTTERVSVADDEVQASAGPGSAEAAVSDDGQIVAFSSHATNLVPGDTNGTVDVFVRDRQAGTTERVSVGPNGEQGFVAASPTMSADGRYVAFYAYGSLADGAPLGQIYVRDRVDRTTERVSFLPGGSAPVWVSSEAALSGDGRFVAFVDKASDHHQVYLRDLATDTTELISRDDAGVPGGGGPTISGWSGSYRPALSRDGSKVAFLSTDPNLVAMDTNGAVDVFVRDRAAGTTRRLGTDGGAQPNGDSGPFAPAVSDDGTTVAFTSAASNLVAGDTNSRSDAFRTELATGTTTRVSLEEYGGQLSWLVYYVALTGDGRQVAFDSTWATPETGVNGAIDVFVRVLDGEPRVPFPNPASLRLFPATATGRAGTTHRVEARLSDNRFNAAPGVVIRFTVTGAVTTAGSCTTDASGECAFIYQGPAQIGTDTITAFADVDGDSVRDANEVPMTASMDWNLAADTTPPTIDLRTPAEGAVYPTGGVTADFSCSDEQDGSGIADCRGELEVNGIRLSVSNGSWSDLDTYFAPYGPKKFIVTAWDVSGNTRTVVHEFRVGGSESSTLAVVAPTGLRQGQEAVFTAAVSAGGTQASDAAGTVVFRSQSSGWVGTATVRGGVATASFYPQQGTHDITASYSGDQTYAPSDADPVDITVGPPDLIAPTVTIVNPPNGAAYTVGDVVPVHYSCQDDPGGTGIATCAGSMPDGSSLDTTRPGTFQLTVSAADATGNGASASSTYRVAEEGASAVVGSDGGTVSTDPDHVGPTASDPIETTVSSPVPGLVSIAEGPITSPAPTGFTLFGRQVDITAPVATASEPLVLTFDVDASAVPAGQDANSVQVFRNRVLVETCLSETAASPDPCVAERQTAPSAGGDLRLVIRTSAASAWNVGFSANRRPTADAGPDQLVSSGADFFLDGSRSSDPERQPLRYRWVQVSGPPAIIDNERTARTLVRGVRGPTSASFKLVVTDSAGLQHKDLVGITVKAPK